jgi:glycosyltransferase involved in cell wall biosynthesis
VCLLQTLHAHDDKRMFHKLGRSLATAGYEIVSVVPDTGDVPRERDGIHFVTIPRAEGLLLRALVLPALLRAALASRADIHVAPEPESWAVALLAKALRGGKCVFDMHEHVPTEFAKFFPGRLQSTVERITVLGMRLFARYTDLIIRTRDSFEAPWAGLAVPRITVINTNHLQPACSRIPESLSAAYANRPTIIHQGIFGDVRGSYQLLDSLKILVKEFPDLRCIVLGEYVYGSLEDYRRAIHEAGLTEHLHLLGKVPFEEVPAHIAVSRVGLILFQPGPLNHTLAMPHKLFDYMREGKPAVVPDFAVEVAHIVRETDCGILVDVTNPAAIAEAVARLLRDPNEAARLGSNGRAAVETKYNWQAEERILLEAFGALAEQPGPAPR